MIQNGSFRFRALCRLPLLVGMLAAGGCDRAGDSEGMLSDFLIALGRQALSAFLL